MSLFRNIMIFIDFYNQLSHYPIFSLHDVKKVFSEFSYRQLDRWEKKGYLKKIKRGFYCFESQIFDRNFLFLTANKIYSPSYVSLEVALSFYDLIPEEIFQITSVSTKKTVGFQTPVGSFRYRHIKPSLYWGYRLVDFDSQKILVADPEKAVLDYLYLHPSLKSPEDFEEMRINIDEFKSQINIEKFKKYLISFENKQLLKRAKIFLTTIENDNT